MRFLLSDASLNRYGSRVLTEGIELSAFRRNPVMFWNHDRRRLPIGRWQNIGIANGQLTAEAHFDPNDPLAQAVKQKAENGIVNAASIGFEVLELSDKPEHLLPNQTRPTVSRCALREVSLVDIPANPNALRQGMAAPVVNLQFDNQPPTNVNNLLPLLNPQLQPMQALQQALGLPQDATDNQTQQAIENLKNQRLQLTQALARMAAAFAGADAQTQTNIATLALKDFDTTLTMVEKMANAQPKQPSLSQTLSANSYPQANTRHTWTLRDWETKDPNGLSQLRQQQPETYQRMFTAYYGN